jgi:hypothetical protein
LILIDRGYHNILSKIDKFLSWQDNRFCSPPLEDKFHETLKRYLDVRCASGIGPIAE